MNKFIYPKTLLWVALAAIAGCDQSSLMSLRDETTSITKLYTDLPANFSVLPLNTTLQLSKKTSLQFPMLVSKDQANAADPAFGVIFVSDGTISNPHLELVDPLENIQEGETLSSYEADGPTRQVSKVSVTLNENGFTTQALFYDNSYLPEANTATHVLVAFYDENALTEEAQYFRLFNRAQLANGITNLPNSPLGQCLGNTEQVQRCEQTTATRALKNKGHSGATISAAPICLPASIGSGGINYYCFGGGSAALSKSTSIQNADAHVRLDFHLVLDPQNPLSFTQPERMIAAYVMEGNTAFGLAGYKRPPSQFTTPFPVEIDRFRQTSGLTIH
ncbi:MAG: hypothetical protein JNN12_03715 [Bacteroidetes Order II. Incertae sedis bacterium]|nr:hypothetical protein [Bacteroidetes Order II. bacterium]